MDKTRIQTGCDSGGQGARLGEFFDAIQSVENEYPNQDLVRNPLCLNYRLEFLDRRFVQSDTSRFFGHS
jgi:hypothetical protein